jgi:hypothetical protein
MKSIVSNIEGLSCYSNTEKGRVWSGFVQVILCLHSPGQNFENCRHGPARNVRIVPYRFVRVQQALFDLPMEMRNEENM